MVQSTDLIHNGMVGMAALYFGGIIKEASLEMLPTVAVVDYVLVPVGEAISSIDTAGAAKTFECLKAMGKKAALLQPAQTDLNK